MFYVSLDESVGIVTGENNLDHILRDCPIGLTKDAFIRVAKDEFDHMDLGVKYEHGRWHRKDQGHLRPIMDSDRGALNLGLKI